MSPSGQVSGVAKSRQYTFPKGVENLTIVSRLAEHEYNRTANLFSQHTAVCQKKPDANLSLAIHYSIVNNEYLESD